MNNEQVNQANEQVHAFAALVGSTQAELNNLDENIVGDSSCLKPGQFQGEAVLKNHIHNTRQAIGAPPVPVQHVPHQSTPPPVPAVMPEHSQPAPQFIPQQVQSQQVQSHGSELTIILQKLVEIESQISTLNRRLSDIEHFDKKVVDSLTRGLQNKVKQVTIKLDDTKSR